MPKNTSSQLTESSVKRFKQEAKKLVKERSITHAKALDIIAKNNKFPNWKAVLSELKKEFHRNVPTPTPSLGFLTSSDVILSSEDKITLSKERSTELQDNEKILLSKNRAALAKIGIDYSIFEPTLTGLKKSILDATQTVRTHFNLVDFHTYETQGQGIDYKVIKDAFFVDPENTVKTRMSLYRPTTKSGDPRMWFSKLNDFSQAGDQIAIIIFLQQAFLLNLTKVDLNKSILDFDNIGLFISRYSDDDNAISQELLNKLREIARLPLVSIGHGDTSIGMSIEAALGIPPNSSKLPDYKGIEIKSSRSSKTRTTIFAQVANWKISTCKSSSEILDQYGYDRDNDFRLYCTTSSRRHNSQGLIFQYDQSTDILHEHHISGAHVASWEGELLRNRLHTKHKETFWVDATSEIINGKEVFHLHSVTHTKNPLLTQLMPLISSGVITMDHLIKRTTVSGKTKVSEKGPLFKINKKHLGLIFPTPVKYSLIGEFK